MAGLPRGGQLLRVSAFGRHMIDDENADHDADQQRRQKKIFHFVDPFTLQSRTVHAMENFVGIGVRPSFVERELTLHGGCSINRVRAGTTIPWSLQGKGRAKPGLIPIRGQNRLGRRQLLCRGDRCGRCAGGLACIGGKIRPGRETQCGCAGNDEDGTHLMSP